MNAPITFSYNWNNKLLCPCFTTIRLRNDYRYQVGQTYPIEYNKEVIGEATIKNIKHFQLHDLSDFMAGIDTGYEVDVARELIRTMYKNSNINWQVQELSFIMLVQPATKVRYVIPTQLKLTDKKAELFPETTMFHH